MTNELFTGLLRTRTDADITVQCILSTGHPFEDISLIMRDPTRELYLATEGHNAAAPGSMAATIVGRRTRFALPGIHLSLVGPLALELLQASAASATEGLVSALVGVGIPAFRAAEYEKAIGRGGVFVGVRARSERDARKLESIFAELGENERVEVPVLDRREWESRPLRREATVTYRVAR